MNYLIVKDGAIENIIVCQDDKTAEKFGAVPYYDGAVIGSTYDPPDLKPEPDPEPTQLDRIEAQAVYTAMMTDTLLEV